MLLSRYVVLTSLLIHSLSSAIGVVAAAAAFTSSLHITRKLSLDP